MAFQSSHLIGTLDTLTPRQLHCLQIPTLLWVVGRHAHPCVTWRMLQSRTQWSAALALDSFNVCFPLSKQTKRTSPLFFSIKFLGPETILEWCIPRDVVNSISCHVYSVGPHREQYYITTYQIHYTTSNQSSVVDCTCSSSRHNVQWWIRLIIQCNTKC